MIGWLWFLGTLLPVAGKAALPGKPILFTAAGGSEFAGPLPYTERPAFSYLVLGALRGWADEDGDKQVTAEEALDYTRNVLSATITGRTQTPSLAAGDKKAVLAVDATEQGPDISAIVAGGE